MSGYFQVSDINLKSNIQPLINNISIIKQLQPKSFTYKINQFPNHSLPDGIHDGLIAQDVLNVLPHLVKALKVPPTIDSLGNMDTTATSNTFLSVNYIGLIPYLIGAFKEQQDGIDSLTSLLSQMQSQIDNCCNASGHLRKSTDVELSDETSIILDKNSPNPFSEETYITYTIPERVSKAMIIIYNQTGVVLKKVVIEERGEGSLHVYAEKLSSGVYTYSLVADGITIDSKQMVCQK
jgi:hypothetical protein